MDTYQKDILCLIDKYAENEKLLYHFNINDICSYSPSVEKMDNMMRCHGFVMLLRCSEKFQSYLEKILPWCKPEETCLIYSQYHGYIDKREGNTAFNQKLYDFVEQFRERKRRQHGTSMSTARTRKNTTKHISGVNAPQDSDS